VNRVYLKSLELASVEEEIEAGDAAEVEDLEVEAEAVEEEVVDFKNKDLLDLVNFNYKIIRNYVRIFPCM
jgi:hypothetical protein